MLAAGDRWVVIRLFQRVQRGEGGGNVDAVFADGGEKALQPLENVDCIPNEKKFSKCEGAHHSRRCISYVWADKKKDTK